MHQIIILAISFEGRHAIHMVLDILFFQASPSSIYVKVNYIVLSMVL